MKTCRGFGAVIFSMCLLGANVSAGATRPTRDGRTSPSRHRALWVWDHGAAARDEAARQQLFEFAKAHQIDVLYYESSRLLQDKADLADFLKAAAARGVSVELLLSSNRWVYPQNQAQAVAEVRQASDLAASLSGVRPVALHFDIEPYLLPEWRTGHRSQIEADYLALLQKIEASRHGLPVHVDIPFWFSRVPVDLNQKGAEPLDEAIFAVVDGCTVMDYRNAATGPDGIIKDGQRLMADADRAGKPLLIGVETNPIVPNFVTFYGMSAKALNGQLSIVDQAFQADQSFAGTAVEDYKGYRKLSL